MKKTYLSLALIYLFALLLAVIPALMVWKWHLMAAGDPTTVLCLIASWVCALLIMAVCTWYYHQIHTTASRPEVLRKTADSPAA